MDVAAALKAKFPHDVVDELLSAYREIEQNFVLKKWKASELDAGHFVEAARRILEHELTGTFTPISASLSKFTDQVLKGYENASGHESYRMLIPRALKSVYNIRNKRGVGHISGVSPNEMDSTYILHTVKWVLAELVRLASGLSVSKTQELVDAIVERNMELIWKQDGVERVLNTSMSARNQVLLLLYSQSPRQEDELRDIIEYSHKANFRAILKKLHKARLIEYQGDGKCLILPPGIIEAEGIATKKVSKS